MLTRAGRVVVMDFGIARAASERRDRNDLGHAGLHGARAGARRSGRRPEPTCSPRAWCSPRWSRPGGFATRRGARSGLATAARRAAAQRATRRGQRSCAGRSHTARDHRYSTAAVARARARRGHASHQRGDEAQRPYPGLASFTEQDAEYFVGRELEIEEMWKKLRRPHLLALIGPSGAGKSSFLRAGLAPTAPPGWRWCSRRPADRPFAALAHALAPELAGDVRRRRAAIDFEQPDVASRSSSALAPPARSRAARPRSVRGAVHAEPAGGSGALRAAARPAGARCRRSRAAVHARRLPVSLPRVREPGPAVLGADRARAARPALPCGGRWSSRR